MLGQLAKDFQTIQEAHFHVSSSLNYFTKFSQDLDNDYKNWNVIETNILKLFLNYLI